VALLFMDGFDKYGGPNTAAANVAALLAAGEWTSAGGGSIVTGLSGTGYALQLGNAPMNISKTLSASYGRLIGGMRFAHTFGSNVAGVQFLDGASNQAAISFNLAGTISLRNGSVTGTALGTSTATISSGSIHHLEWDISFGNSASYQLWLDGVSILSGTGDTTATANNTASGLQLLTNGSAVLVVDDLYLFDASGTTNNAPLLTSPRIETQLPSSDAAVQFAFGAAMLGASQARATGSVSTAANQLRLRSVVPAVNCTLNAISFLASLASGAVNLRPVVYSSVSGVPGALLGSGSTVTGTTASTLKTMPLTSGVALSAGTQYFVGFMCDIAVTNGLAGYTAVADDFTAIATFASGAPGTAPVMANTASSVIAGNVAASGANWFSVAQNPVQGGLSYVADATVGHEDLYGYPLLSAVPLAIYAVAVKASVAKSDAGAKTLSLRLKSGGTDSAGSAGTLAPGTSYGWLTSLYPTDPATGTAWTAAALNAAQAGVRVES
jgi:hypothetical protein